MVLSPRTKSICLAITGVFVLGALYLLLDRRGGEALLPTGEIREFEELSAPAGVPKFSDFPVKEKSSGIAAELKFGADPRLAQYADAIEKEAALGANFAGHFSLVALPCGTGCDMIAVVDLRDGMVHMVNLIAEFGLKFSPDSSLLILNPATKEVPLSARNTGPSSLPTYYNWQENKFVFVYHQERD